MRPTSTSKNQTQKDQAQNDNDFDRRQPELEFSEESNTEVIDDDNGHQENCDECTRVDLVTRNPVLKDERRSSQIVWCDNNILLMS